jgi:hypothetical protein
MSYVPNPAGLQALSNFTFDADIVSTMAPIVWVYPLPYNVRRLINTISTNVSYAITYCNQYFSTGSSALVPNILANFNLLTTNLNSLYALIPQASPNAATYQQQITTTIADITALTPYIV